MLIENAFRLAVALVLSGGVAWIPQPTAANESASTRGVESRQAHETRPELTPDPSRVAVLVSEPEAPPEMDALAASTGMGFRRMRRFGPGFRMLDLSEPEADAALRRRNVEQLAAETGVEYATQVYRTERGLAKFPRPVVFVRFRAGLPDEAQREALGRVPGLRIEQERFGFLDRVWKLASAARTGDVVLEQVRQLAATPDVVWAEPDWMWEVTPNAVFPDDPDFDQSWPLHNTGQSYDRNDDGFIDIFCTPGIDMNAPEAWELTSGDPAVIVMILDVGVDLSHPDLNVAHAADFTERGTGGGPTWPWADHGTVVAGCAAALMNNGLLSAGVAPGVLLASASIARDDDDDGGHVASSSWFVQALGWGLQIGARVATSQVGPTDWSSLIADAYDIARDHGMVLFAASGNSPTSDVGYPGIYRSVNAVGGIFCDGQSYGTTGNALFLVGPAADVYTTALGGGFDMTGGTSLSSPFAAGVAALVLSANPSLSPAGVEMAMIVGARDLGLDGFDSRFGHGLLRADEAIVAGGEIAQGAAVVDASLGGPPGAAPFDVHLHPSVAAGVSAVPDHGAVLVRGGLPYDEVLVIDKPLVMRAWDGEAVIGE